jgi:hypothetical protein
VANLRPPSTPRKIDYTPFVIKRNTITSQELSLHLLTTRESRRYTASSIHEPMPW